MALSVLHKESFEKDDCGVWCSITKSWLFHGTSTNCYDWKNAQEDIEQAALFEFEKPILALDGVIIFKL